MTNFEKHYSYVGTELEVFSQAHNWKKYFSRLVAPCLRGDVLEVGAGIGSTTEILCRYSQAKWVCLEPDPALANIVSSSLTNGYLPSNCEIHVGSLESLRAKNAFDSVIYIDVLEHIENDDLEVKLASKALKPGGFLIVLAPAHQWLFTPFDQAVGHYRRYNKQMLSLLIPETLECVSLRYLDCVGLMASLGNRIFLKQKMPTSQQVKLWDRAMVPLSVKLDPLLRYTLGKSVLGIWRKKL
jgi:SAM-dependent methyltransferase